MVRLIVQIYSCCSFQTFSVMTFLKFGYEGEVYCALWT
ncbi:MAG: hypothetical protein QOJ04_5903 [Caballeronia sp.]|nr:hypothetical protein [Caballeronia sp.]